jgi:hypothetical protein
MNDEQNILIHVSCLKVEQLDPTSQLDISVMDAPAPLTLLPKTFKFNLKIGTIFKWIKT